MGLGVPREDPGELPRSPHPVRIQQIVGPSAAWGGSLTESDDAGTLALNLQPPGMVRNKCLWFRSHPACGALSQRLL